MAAFLPSSPNERGVISPQLPYSVLYYTDGDWDAPGGVKDTGEVMFPEDPPEPDKAPYTQHLTRSSQGLCVGAATIPASCARGLGLGKVRSCSASWFRGILSPI